MINRLKNSIAFTILVMGILIITTDRSAVAQFGSANSIKLKSFKTQEFDPKTGKLTWRLEGTEAILKGSIVLLKKAKVTLFDEQGKVSTVINSNNSTFHKVKKIWESDERVHITDKRMLTTGIGFELYVEKGKQKLYIKKDVKVKLKIKQPDTKRPSKVKLNTETLSREY